MMFAIGLSRELGMTCTHMLRTMPSQEMIQQLAYNKIRQEERDQERLAAKANEGIRTAKARRRPAGK